MVQSQATFSWWHWHFHPDIVLGILLLEGIYLLGVGPLRKRFALASSVESRQVAIFSLGVLVLYVALTGPIHELSDSYLFSAHMVQHLLIMLVAPRLLLAGTPGWLLRPLVRPPLVLATGRFLSNPVMAFLIFTFVLSVWHLPFLYDLTLRSHAAHVTEHLMFIASAVIMWWPLMSPLPELPRASYPVQMVYLFFLSLPMSFVGAAITFSHSVLYPWYGEVPRLWGLSTVADQQIAGLIMKVPGALIFMAVLVVTFFTWYNCEGASEPAQPSPTPEIKESQAEVVTPTPGATLIEGRPYLRETTSGAVIYYEPQIAYQIVGKIKDAFAEGLNILEQELGALPPEKVAIFLSGEAQFTRLASAHGFPETAFLLGFYAPSPKEGEGAAAGVYLNADDESLFHTLGHELTHAAVPGLPSWFSEGLADYIGTRVENAMYPGAQLARMQVFRRLVRDAVNDGTLLDQKALETFDLRADHRCLDLDRFYGQAWQFVEYVGRWYGPYALRGLVASYRDNTQSDDPFNTVLGTPVETLWQRFSKDIVENLTAEERVAQSLDDLQRLASQAEAITRDWAQFLATSSVAQPETFAEGLRGFGERWDSLAQQTAGLAAPRPATSIRNLWYLYFQSMALAMQELAQGNDASANRRVAIANQAYSLAAASLRDSFLRRSQLSCE